MPTRILREGIITSEPVNSLKPTSELFYRRLMSVIDDYGRYFAHPSLLRAACYPLQLESVSEADVKRMLSDCVAVALIALYGQNKYLQCLNFRQQTRSKSKFPEPTENELLSNCKADVKQLQTTLTLDPNTTTTTTTTPTTTPTVRNFVEEIYKAYPLHVGKPAAVKAIGKALESSTFEFLLEKAKAYATARGGDMQWVPHPATWFNQQRFNDSPETWAPRSQADQVPLSDRIKLTQEAIDKHPANPDEGSLYAIENPTQEQRAEFDALLLKIEFLKKQAIGK